MQRALAERTSNLDRGWWLATSLGHEAQGKDEPKILDGRTTLSATGLLQRTMRRQETCPIIGEKLAETRRLGTIQFLSWSTWMSTT